MLFSVSFYCVFEHITLLIEQLFSKLAGDAELFVLLTVLQARYIDQKKKIEHRAFGVTRSCLL